MPPHPSAAEIARALAARAENVCRHYLPAGRREGRYWMVGDVRGAPGRSLFVRLTGPASGPGAAGKWTDGATGEHGDLLDIVRLSRGHSGLADAIDDARQFLAAPIPAMPLTGLAQDRFCASNKVFDHREAAKRLWRAAGPVAGTIGARYLAQRGIARLLSSQNLRYLRHCWTRRARDASPGAWPALIAAIRDVDGELQAVQRTWIDPATFAKAPLPNPRKTLGPSYGHAVGFGPPGDALLAGEGLETMLSLYQALPQLWLAAATSSSHLSGLIFPQAVRHLIVARDDDAAGAVAEDKLRSRAAAAGLAFSVLVPQCGDFNDDLTTLGHRRFAAAVRQQVREKKMAGS